MLNSSLGYEGEIVKWRDFEDSAEATRHMSVTQKLIYTSATVKLKIQAHANSSYQMLAASEY